MSENKLPAEWTLIKREEFIPKILFKDLIFNTTLNQTNWNKKLARSKDALTNAFIIEYLYNISKEAADMIMELGIDFCEEIQSNNKRLTKDEYIDVKELKKIGSGLIKYFADNKPNLNITYEKT